MPFYFIVPFMLRNICQWLSIGILLHYPSLFCSMSSSVSIINLWLFVIGTKHILGFKDIASDCKTKEKIDYSSTGFIFVLTPVPLPSSFPCIDWFPDIYPADKLTISGFQQHNENWFQEANLAYYMLNYCILSHIC